MGEEEGERAAQRCRGGAEGGVARARMDGAADAKGDQELQDLCPWGARVPGQLLEQDARRLGDAHAEHLVPPLAPPGGEALVEHGGGEAAPVGRVEERVEEGSAGVPGQVEEVGRDDGKEEGGEGEDEAEGREDAGEGEEEAVDFGERRGGGDQGGEVGDVGASGGDGCDSPEVGVVHRGGLDEVDDEVPDQEIAEGDPGEQSG